MEFIETNYALFNGKLIHVSEVEKGKKCNCTCPSCGKPLIAKKGKKKAHHFCHPKNKACEYAYETALHMLAKEILCNCRQFVLPSVKVYFENSHKKTAVISGAKEIVIDKVDSEKAFDDVIPDVVIYSGGKKFFVEIYVTHKIDEIKISKLKESKISTIEIDLSKIGLISKEELKKILIEDNKHKVWKYNAYAERCLQRFYDIADKRQLIKIGNSLYAKGCPISDKKFYGDAYANFYNECVDCEYCIFNDDEKTILCLGDVVIPDIKEYSLKIDERKAKNKARDLKRTDFSSSSLSHDELYQSILPSMNDPSLLRVIDITGMRWVRCEKCGQIKTIDKFWTYHDKTGSCYECDSERHKNRG